MPVQTKVLSLSRSASFCISILVGTLLSGLASGQVLTFSGSQTAVPVTGLSSPTDVIFDNAGNILIADTANNRVVKILANTGVQTTVGSNLLYPKGLAVDAAGDIFIADSGNNRIVKVTPSGAQTALGGNFSGPSGVAVDAAGDVFVADTLNNDVVKIPVGGLPAYQIATNLNFPWAVAVDATGNVYIADTYNSRVLKVPAVGGAAVRVGTGFNFPEGLTVDASGNLYVADTFNNRVVEVSAAGTQSVVSIRGLSYPTGIAPGPNGVILVADQGNNRVLRAQLGAVAFGSVNVCPSGATTPTSCTNTLSLLYSANSPVTLGATSALTMGIPNLDFTVASGSTCVGALTAGETCSLDITFNPTTAGARLGAIELNDSAGNVLITTMVSGTGVGPQLLVQNLAPITVYPGPVNNGLTIDGAGNLYFANPVHHNIAKIPANGGSPIMISAGIALRNPFALTMDGAGNLYVADSMLQEVIKVPTDGNAPSVLLPVPEPEGIAVDTAGNLYVCDPFHNQIDVIPFGSSVPSASISATAPLGIAVDGAGNIFYSLAGTGQVHEIPTHGAEIAVVNLRNYDVDGPVNALVLTPAGRIIASSNSGIYEISPSGTVVNLTGDIGGGLAINAQGDVFFVHPVAGDVEVAEIPRHASMLSFASTIKGQTSSPQRVLIDNGGNETVTMGPIAISSTNFGIIPGPARSCGGVTLLVNLDCDFEITFKPNALGALAGMVTLQGDSPNGSPASLVFQLSGTGLTNASVTTLTASPASTASGSAVALTAHVTASSGTPTGTVTFSRGGTVLGSAALNASGVANITSTTLPSGIDLVTAAYSGDSTFTASSGTTTVTIAAGPPAPSVVSLSPNAGAGMTQVFSATYSDTLGASDISVARLLFNANLDITGACYVLYFPSTNALYLANNLGNQTTPITPGTSASESNSQCTLSGSGSSATLSGSSLKLTVAITFNNTFVGQKNAYLLATSKNGASSPWIIGGTWTPARNGEPSAVSLSPSSGSGLTRTFTAVYSDQNGAEDLSSARIVFNSTLNGANACYVIYLPATNMFNLVLDSGIGSTGIVAGNPGHISNSQCTLSGAGSSATVSGNTLTLSMALTFSSSFTGSKNVYLDAIENSNATSGWQQLGTWTP
jgi:sugar lactone lactonase YvrE